MKRTLMALLSAISVAACTEAQQAPPQAPTPPPISLRCVTESPAKFAGMTFSLTVDESTKQVAYNDEPSTQPSISATQIKFRHGNPPLDYDIDRVSGGFRIYVPGAPGMLGHCELTPQKRF